MGHADGLPPKKVLCSFRQNFDDYGPKGCRRRAESPLLVSESNNSAVKNFLPEA